MDKATATLIAAIIAALVSIYSACRSRKTAIEVAKLNADFAEELKRHEYRLTYQKEIATKRMGAHDRLLGLIDSLFMPEYQDQSEVIKENPFRDPNLLNNYLVDLFSFSGSLHWLDQDALVRFYAFRNAVRDAVDLFDRHPTSRNIPMTTEGKHVRRTALQLRTQLIHDYFHLHEIEDFAGRLSAAELTYSPDSPSEPPLES